MRRQSRRSERTCLRAAVRPPAVSGHSDRLGTVPTPVAPPAAGREPAVTLRARDVYKVFVARGRARTALRAVNLEVRRGEFLTLIGPSGCGKSTVLNMFAGLTDATDGEVLHDGRPVRGVNTRVGYVTQDDNLLPWRTTVANVEIALELKGVPRAARRERALAYLARVGLAGWEQHYPHELSGGMRKRVSIVRTLVDESINVILMDEPLGPLDAQTRLLLQDELLQLWQGSGRTVIFVTHDLVEAIALSDRIAIFTSAPGTIKAVREVPIDRPRDVFHIHEAPGFPGIYDAIWNDLREEIRKVKAGGD
jgi:NitT/TauT family transport system ATP-binding protein